MKNQLKTLVAGMALLAIAVAPALAGSDQDASAKKSDEAKRMQSATTTLDEIMQIPDKGIPGNMLEHAAGVAVIPGVVKAGFIAGAEHGKGVMSIRREDGSWSNPVFTNLTGGSIGWQAGVKSSDIVLVFMSRKNVEDVIDGEFTLGGNVAVAAGPVGRTGGAGANLKLDSGIYVYARSRGAFAGISLDGSKLYVDKDANARYYGEGATPQTIVAGKDVKARKGSEQFVATLAASDGGKGSSK